MMRKFLIIAIPIIALVSFTLIMLSGNILKKSLVNENNIPKSIQLINKNIESEDWVSANENTETLSNTWRKVVNRIQFSSERDEINSFDTSLARLKGAITAKDKSASLMELSETYEHWDGLGK